MQAREHASGARFDDLDGAPGADAGDGIVQADDNVGGGGLGEKRASRGSASVVMTSVTPSTPRRVPVS